LKNEFRFNEDKKEGLGREWWSNGELSLEGYYKNGKANGLMKWYSEKGHLAAIGQMVNDKREGEWKICDWQDSTYCTYGRFRDEVEYGVWISYHGNGKTARQNTYEAGKIIESQCWNEEGQSISCEQ